MEWQPICRVMEFTVDGHVTSISVSPSVVGGEIG
jgi:hypothetical protein